MNQESNRLQSFDSWTSETNIDPRIIAKAGFYYTGQGQEVQCFRCGGKISEWNIGDDIMVRHRQLDPQCPFFTNPLASGNIPLPDPNDDEPTDLSRNSYSYIDDVDMNLDEIYKNDAMRLLSFVNWPLSYISRESLAVAGFYYMGGKPGVPIDKVRCAWCGGELENWMRDDKPIVEHTRHFPNCTYAKDKLEAINQSESQGFCNENLLRDNMTELGIQSHEAINRSDFCTLESRLQSFRKWPRNHCQNPKDLAAAGFYYAGIADEVRCFYCDGGLCNWTPNDNPWIEHAKYHPRCDFINLIKGREFVDRHRKNRSANPNIRDEDIEQYMNSEFAAAALQCGIQPGRLRRAIRVRLEKTGTPFLSTEALIDAALNEQLNETAFPTVVLSGSPPPYDMPSDDDAGPSSSSTGRQVRIDDATIDNVTRMIIDSALSGTDTFPVSSNSSGIMSTENIEPENLSQTVNVMHTDEYSETDEDIETVEDNETVEDIETDEDIETVRHIQTVKHIPTVKPIQTVEDTEKTMNQSNSNHSDLSLEEENRLLKEARTCKVCMDSEVGIVFLPCGHLVTCVECAICLAQCPLCRSTIKGVVKTYLS